MWNLCFCTLNRGGLGEGFLCSKKAIKNVSKKGSLMFKTFLKLHNPQIRISHLLSCYIWNCSVSNLIPDQIPHTHTYCFLSKSLESHLFYVYHPLLSSTLASDIKMLRRKQEEWRAADFPQLSLHLLLPWDPCAPLRLHSWVRLGKAFSAGILLSFGMLAPFPLLVFDKYLGIPVLPQVLASSVCCS